MSKLINGDYSFAYPNFLGNQKITSDMVMDAGTTKTLEQTLTSLESNGSSLTGDIVIGSTAANTISVNSGLTTYNNATIIKIKDNTSPAFKLQCNDAGSTDLIVINSINGNEGIYLPFKNVELGNAVASNIQIGDGTNVGATNIFGVVSLKNPTESLSYTSTNCTNTPGGLSVYKNLNIGSSLGVASSSVFGGNMSVGGSITSTNITDSTSTTGAVVTSGGICCTKKLYVGGNISGAGNITVSGNVYGSNAYVTGISMLTSGGTASLLNYYEEYTSLANLWSPSGGGAWLNSANTMTLIRIGNIVHLKIKAFSGDALGGYIHNVAIIPVRFCPSGSAQFPIQVLNLWNNQLGLLSILSTGYTNIYATIAGGNFSSGAGAGLLVDTFVSWTMI